MLTLEQARTTPIRNPWQRPEAWYALGLQKERLGDPKTAAYCYYLACDMGRCRPALERLQQLGYLAIR